MQMAKKLAKRIAKKKAVVKRKRSTKSFSESAFAHQFSQYEAHPENLTAQLPRPIMQQCRVTHVFRQDGICHLWEEFANDPWTPNVTVDAYSQTQTLETHHTLAWQHILTNSVAIEKRLRTLLWKDCRSNIKEFFAELEIDDPECQWANMKDITDWRKASALDYQICLKHMALLDSRSRGIAHIAFTFDIGWDMEHGFCAVMHKNRVLAVNDDTDEYY